MPQTTWISMFGMPRSGSAVDETFEDFYARDYRAALVFAYTVSGDRLLAEDLTQDVFVSAFRDWDGIRHPQAWVRAAISNRVRSAWRRKYTERNAMEKLIEREAVLIEMPSDTASFWAEVARLPQRQADALILFYLEDRPVEEIAKVFGCAESTARVHLTRARKALASRLGVEE